MRRILLVAVITLLALSLPGAGPQGAGAEPRGIAYKLDLTSPESGRVRVTLEIETGASPLVLEMDDSYGDGLAVDLSMHVREETAADASGAPLAVRREGAAWYVEGAGKMTFSYEVVMDGYRAGTHYLDSLASERPGWPYFPFLDADLAYLPAYAVLVRPRGGGEYLPSLELDMPPQWRSALPWADQPAGLEELLSNPVCAGELATQEGGSLLVALPASSAAASGNGLGEYAAKAGSLLSTTERMLGGPVRSGEGRLLVFLLLRGEGGEPGAAPYPSAPFSRCAVVSAAASADILSDAVIEATAGSMAEMWLDASIPAAREALWLRYGAARYLQCLIPYQAGIWGAQTFWDRFYRSYDLYREARGRSEPSLSESGALAPEDGSASAVLSCGGAAACAAFDSELRSLRPAAGDLAALLRDLAALAGEGSPIGNDDVRARLESASGREWASFFRDHVQGGREIPASSFSSLNIAPPEGSSVPGESPRGSVSTTDWIILSIAVLVVFAIPFVMEPYTLNPRKPGFLKRKLQEEEGE